MLVGLFAFIAIKLSYHECYETKKPHKLIELARLS